MRVDLRRRRVLVTGWINMNVVDGSAFFLPALASALATDPFTDVTLLSAVPLKRTEVVDEILGLENVQLVDPWRSIPSEKHEHYEMTPGWGTREGHARLVGDLDEEHPFDLLIVRDTLLADVVLQHRPDLADRLVVYVTGVTFADPEPDEELAWALQRLGASGVAAFATQTDSMVDALRSLAPEVADRAFVLPPMVAGSATADEAPVEQDVIPTRLIYTGKFFPLWNPREMISGFRVARVSQPDLTLTLVGDQIGKDPDDAAFTADMKRQLASPDLWWTGAVPRATSRALIRQHHLGLSWRAPAMDHSLELSTKLLEYGALGRPCLINRNSLHQEIFGADYPFFANSTGEFVQQLTTLTDRADDYREAALRAHRVAANYSYERGRDRLDCAVGFSAASEINLREDLSQWFDPAWLHTRGTLTGVGSGARWVAGHEDDAPAVGLEMLLTYLSSGSGTQRTRDEVTAAADRRLEGEADPSPEAAPAGDDLVIGRLKQDLEVARSARAAMNVHYQALRNSPLGRLQSRYWALRKRLGGS